jgi:hypothetical protein
MRIGASRRMPTPAMIAAMAMKTRNDAVSGRRQR